MKAITMITLALLALPSDALATNSDSSLDEAAEQWTFFPSADKSSLSFDAIVPPDVFMLPKEDLRGQFAISVSGDTPTRPLIDDRALAGDLNSFTLQLDGHVENTVLVGAGFPVAVAGRVSGLLTISNGDRSWNLSVTQENFGIMGATFQVDRSRKRIRVYVPIALHHEASGSELHAQLYIMFTGATDGAGLVPEQGKMAIRRTDHRLAAPRSGTKLVDLLSSPPGNDNQRIVGMPAKSTSRFDVKSLQLTSLTNAEDRNDLGSLDNWPVVETTLCTADAVLVACEEIEARQRTVGLRLSGKPLGPADVAGNARNWSMLVNLYPGPSIRGSDGNIVNYIEQFAGTLRIGSHAIEITHANVADKQPTSSYDSSTGTITFSLPAAIGKEGHPHARVMIAATCSKGASSGCTSATLSDATDSLGRVVGNRSVIELGSSFSAGSPSIASSLVVQ